MTGFDIYERAMMLLGYTDDHGNIQDITGLKERAVYAINQIAADLCGMHYISTLRQEINLNTLQTDALVYGVAAMLTLGNNDAERNAIFTSLFNAKRAAAKANISLVEDKLPKGYGG